MNGRPLVTDDNRELVSLAEKVAGELFGVISRSASGFQDKRDKVDVRVPLELDLLSTFGHVTWSETG